LNLEALFFKVSAADALVAKIAKATMVNNNKLVSQRK